MNFEEAKSKIISRITTTIEVFSQEKENFLSAIQEDHPTIASALKFGTERMLNHEHQMIILKNRILPGMEGAATKQELQDQIEFFTDELTRDLLELRPWEHNSTSAMCNLISRAEASATAEVVRILESLDSGL